MESSFRYIVVQLSRYITSVVAEGVSYLLLEASVTGYARPSWEHERAWSLSIALLLDTTFSHM